MAGKQIPVYLFLLLTIISVSFSAPLHYQTLHVTPLPKTHKTQPLSWPTQFPGSKPEPESESETTLSLSLHHIDKLSDHTLDSTPESLFKTRLRRDAMRVEKLCAVSSGSSSVISGMSQGSAEFFTRIGVGTPPNYMYMTLDTGSDVVWLQCSPCRNCYTQTDPIFNPNHSTSFTSVPCGSPLCSKLETRGCSKQNKCLYEVSYGDNSFTTGEFSTETLTFRKTKVPNIAFGCGFDNQGLFTGAAGLLGLGRGQLSFPVQSRKLFGEKFSYCLVDRFDDSNKSSSILFGDSAVSRKTVFTRLIKNPNPKMGTFYYVRLKGFSVGGELVAAIKESIFKINHTSGDGGVIVDSGTAVTRLIKPAYVALRDAFRARASNLKNTSAGPELSDLFDTCFDLSREKTVKVPTVVIHFDGVDVSLPASNCLIPVDSKGTFCFAFAGTTSRLTIIGNTQQQGFRVVYDLAGQKLGFAPKSC